jgi:aryl-alcohol dehydrogenase-like predicted oxidoreductase
MIAKFRGRTPLIALQLEYSLLERTIEGELVPMALEHGLGGGRAPLELHQRCA